LAAGLVGLLAVAAAATALSTWAHRTAQPVVHAMRPVHIIDDLPLPTPSPTPVPHDGLRIRMPEIGIDLPIVEGDGYDAPLYEAAHYPGTRWPGEGGRTVIYAHARVGMFGPLFGGRVGQHVEIVDRGGGVRRYTVREFYPRWPITDTRWLKPGDHE